jgi:hypothetical protein
MCELLAICLLGLMPPWAIGQTPSLSFKGIDLGKATRADVLNRYPGASVYAGRIRADTRNYAIPKCGSIRFSGTGECRSDAVESQLFRIGDTSSGEFTFLEVEEVVEEVEAIFSTQSYMAVVAALEEKYGKPTSAEVTEAKNLAGATLMNRSARWKLSDGEISALERSGLMNTMQLKMTTNRLIAKRLDEHGRSVNDAAKKL